MRLNDDERAMLDGRDGEAVHAAMDLLVRYGEALGAERLVDTNNVSGTVGATMPFLRDYALKESGMDSVFSEFSLDTQARSIFRRSRYSARTCNRAWILKTPIFKALMSKSSRSTRWGRSTRPNLAFSP